MKQIQLFFQILRFLGVLPFVSWKDEKLIKDIERWKTICHIEKSNWATAAILLASYKEFRNLFIYRHRYRRLFRVWIAVVYKPMDTLYILAGEIGGGLFIHHGFSTMIAAKSIGENCWINQQVTIGYNGHGEPPVIGDNVMITCGAKVLGDITVGDNAVIGANAVVIRDVEAGAVMGGVPARELKMKTK